MAAILGGRTYRPRIPRLSSRRDHEGGSSPAVDAVRTRGYPPPRSGPMTAERDPYSVLGIASSAPAEDVAAAYRAQARRHHPDVSRASDAEQRMAEINAAWALLRDPAARAA